MKKDSFTHKIFKLIEKFNYYNSDKVIGQSQYIIDHILSFYDRPNFLYRNIPNIEINSNISSKKNQPISFIYAGLLGVAQGVLEIVKVMNGLNLDFQFDIYGDGNQKKEIEEFINDNLHTKIKFHGSIPKSDLQLILGQYHYSFVPLVTDIKGAFPSKIFELIMHQVPVIYIGEGEAKEYLISKKLGYCLHPDKINQLPSLISEIFNLHKKNHKTLINNCKITLKKDLNFNVQFLKFLKFLNE